jgi:hypothetical protein
MSRRKGAEGPDSAWRDTTKDESAAEGSSTLDVAVPPFGVLDEPHALLKRVYQDPRVDLRLRIKAAKAAIKYEKAPLSGRIRLPAIIETPAQSARRQELLVELERTMEMIRRQEKALRSPPPEVTQSQV